MSGKVVSEDLREQTIKLFGTDDLDDIFPEVPQSAEISSTVPSFDAVLLSLGINPNDIEGEMVQPPAPLQQAFANLRDGLESETAYGAFKDFEVDPASALDPIHSSQQPGRGSGGYPQEEKNRTVARPHVDTPEMPLDQLFPDFSKKPTNVWDALCQKMVSEYQDAETLSPADKERRLRPISLPILKPANGQIQLVEDPTGCVAVMSTGAVLWPAAAALIDWLGSELPAESDTPRHALELGAGLGSVGLFLNMFMGHGVVVTDVAEATELLVKNVNANFKDGVGGPIVENLRWNDTEDIKQVCSHTPHGFDVIVGSDITYREDLLDSLLLTCEKCLKPGGRVFLTMQDRTNEARNFQHACIRGGWRVVSKKNVPPPAIRELKTSSLAEGQEKWDLVPPHIEQIWLFEIAQRDPDAQPQKAKIPVPADAKVGLTKKGKKNEGQSLESVARTAEVIKGFLDRDMGEMLCEQDDRLRKFVSSMQYPPMTEEHRKKLAEAFFDENGYPRETPPDLSFDDETSLLRQRCEQQLSAGFTLMEGEDLPGQSRKSPKASKSPKADKQRKSPKAGDTSQAEDKSQVPVPEEAVANAKLCADGVEWNVDALESGIKATVTFTYEAWLKLGSGESAFRDLIDFEIAEDALRVKHTDNIVLDLRLLHRVDPEHATAKLSGKNRRVVVSAPFLEK